MQPETTYLSLADVIALHALVMVRTGAARSPLRAEGILEAAIMRPQMAAHYEGADLIRQAALLTVGVAQAQAFLDGNKRTAFAACEVFLRLNGSAFRGDPVDMAHQLQALGDRAGDLGTASERFEGWLRDHVSPPSEPPE
jgi:death-on-curing protein